MKTLKCLVMSLLIAFAVGCAGYYEEEKRTPGEFVDDTLISTTVKTVSYTHLTLPTNREV